MNLLRFPISMALCLSGFTQVTAQEGVKWLAFQGAHVLQQKDKWHGLETGNDTNPGFKMKNSLGYGLGFGGWLTNRWGLEASLLTTTIEANQAVEGRNYELSGREIHLFGSGLFNFNPGGKTFFPYVRAGLGLTHLAEPWSQKDSSVSLLQGHGGVGVQGHFDEHLFTGLEARYVCIEGKHVGPYVGYTGKIDSRNEIIALLNVGYRWGSPKSSAKKASSHGNPNTTASKPAKEESQVVKVSLDEAVLHFANDKDTLSPEGVAAVKKVAKELKHYKGDYTLVVSGHSSSVGDRTHNIDLSKRRAKAVAKILSEAGLPNAAIEIQGHGSDKPVAENKTRQGSAKNRRVEIEIKMANSGNVEKHTLKTPIEQ